MGQAEEARQAAARRTVGDPFDEVLAEELRVMREAFEAKIERMRAQVSRRAGASSWGWSGPNPPPDLTAALLTLLTPTPPLPVAQHAKELQQARQRASEEVEKAEKEALKARMDARHAQALVERASSQ